VGRSAGPADREAAEREQDRVFDANKHMSTLSASALALIFAASELGSAGINLALAVLVFGLSLVTALIGMRNALVSGWVAGEDSHMATHSAAGYYLVSLTTFIGGVLLLVVYPVLTSG
jgi:hypothetical protein